MEDKEVCDLCGAESSKLTELLTYGFGIKMICEECAARFDAIFEDEEN